MSIKTVCTDCDGCGEISIVLADTSFCQACDPEGWAEAEASQLAVDVAFVQSRLPVIDQDLLDDLVCDIACDMDSIGLNDTDDVSKQDRLLSEAEGNASDINNQGQTAQLEYLLQNNIPAAEIISRIEA